MKVYKVKVNGKVYEVELESVKESAGKIEAPATSAAAPVAPVSGGAGKDLVAPMAGTILDVKVNVGQTVKVGDVICILEAMKMENEIFAAEGGTVVSIDAAQGASVNSGDVIITLG